MVRHASTDFMKQLRLYVCIYFEMPTGMTSRKQFMNVSDLYSNNATDEKMAPNC